MRTRSLLLPPPRTTSWKEDYVNPPCYRHLAPSKHRMFIVAIRTRTFDTGGIIYREGDDAEEAFVLTEGACEAIQRSTASAKC